MAKRKTTASGRDPEVPAALFEAPGDDVADAAVEDAAVEDPADLENAEIVDDEAAADTVTTDSDDTDALTSDEPLLDEDPSGQDLAGELPDPGPYEVAADEDEAEELDPETIDEDPEQLDEAEETAASATSTTPVRRPRSAKAPVKKKDAPTMTRKEATALAAEKRTGPVTFVQQSIAELRKVVWPTGAQLSQYFVVVLIFVLFIIAIVGLLDLAFGSALLKLLG